MNKLKKLMKKQGFTLVELIIVIAIIAVLAVAAFMMLTKWLGKSRDSRRLGDIGTISRWLQVGYSDIDDGINQYPTVEDQTWSIVLLSGTEEVWYQWVVDVEVAKGASMQKAPLDPSDGNEYTYLNSANRQKFQVLAMLEDGSEATALIDNIYAVELDYGNRIPTTKWFGLGVLLEKETNLPVQYVVWTFTGIDLMVATGYNSVVSDTRIEYGTGIALTPIVKEKVVVVVEAESEPTPSEITIVWDDTIGRKWSDGTYAISCNEYKNPLNWYEYSGDIWNGIYWIIPDAVAFKVYCDMTTGEWGRTLLADISSSTYSILTTDILLGTNSVMDNARYLAIRANSEFWVRFSIPSKEFVYPNSNNITHSCHNITNSIIPLYYRTWENYMSWAHDEKIWCDVTWTDYSLIEYRPALSIGITYRSFQTNYVYEIDGITPITTGTVSYSMSSWDSLKIYIK